MASFVQVTPIHGPSLVLNLDQIATAERLRNGSVQLRMVTGVGIEVDRLEARKLGAVVGKWVKVRPRRGKWGPTASS